MRALVWNCRGAGSPLTIPQLKELVQVHSPSLIFLSETKKKKSFINCVKQWVKFDELFVVDPVGIAGGLAVIWKKDIQVKSILFTSFTIELLIGDHRGGRDWWCVCVYASTDDKIREQQWRVLERRTQVWGECWALMGDLNDITSNGEKWGGRIRPASSFESFNGFINRTALIDLGFVGVPWTWCNNWNKEGEIKERIDRVLGTRQWCGNFGKARVTHVETEASDHCALVLDLTPVETPRKRRFTFDRRWIMQEGVGEVVQEAWEMDQQGSRLYKVQRKIRQVRMNLLNWSKKLNLNSKKQIKQIKKEIQEVKGSQGGEGRAKITGLKRKLVEAYRREEVFWSQKARIKWLQEGDKNTSFFHASVMSRRNRIGLMDLKEEVGSGARMRRRLGRKL
ncbi:uncharacterized protein [Coffea arabica]|uniref:Endonuclease/exonuclease/phosphatase domain-containing protein n=1 Tax=Coffea arabica TaxID=13443 RepID=A0ABM4UF59_COFAR